MLPLLGHNMYEIFPVLFVNGTFLSHNLDYNDIVRGYDYEKFEFVWENWGFDCTHKEGSVFEITNLAKKQRWWTLWRKTNCLTADILK